MEASRRSISSRTQAGEGTLGLPSEKSKTFSLPISAARRLPYSKISRMTERSSPNFCIVLFNISFPPNVYFAGAKRRPVCGAAPLAGSAPYNIFFKNCPV